MTDHERRLVLRGMSIARGLLRNTGCTHDPIVRAYQESLADAWNLNDEGNAIYREEFKQLVVEINAAIAAKNPDAIPLGTNRKGPIKH
jgi:hypothetical protein